MGYFRKKKAKRDCSAGLVFPWRRVPGNKLGVIGAFSITTFLFVFLATAVKIDIRQPFSVPNRSGEILILGERDPIAATLLQRAENLSPFPIRWDPASDPDTWERIRSQQALATTQSDLIYHGNLQPLPDFRLKPTLSNVYRKGQRPMPELDASWKNSAPASANEPLQIAAKLSVSKELTARLQDSTIQLSGAIPREWYGLSFNYLISINANGDVVNFLPIDSSIPDATDKNASRAQSALNLWIQALKFTSQPAEKSTSQPTFGTLNVELVASQP